MQQQKLCPHCHQEVEVSWSLALKRSFLNRKVTLVCSSCHKLSYVFIPPWYWVVWALVGLFLLQIIRSHTNNRTTIVCSLVYFAMFQIYLILKLRFSKNVQLVLEEPKM